MTVSPRKNGTFIAKVRLPSSVGMGMAHVGTYRSEEEAREACRVEYGRIHDGTSVFLSIHESLATRVYAEGLGVPHGTLKRWVHEGMPVVKVGVTVRIVKDVADAWVKEHHANSVSFGRRGSIYVVERDTDSAVKIGWTSDIRRRLHDLKKDEQAAIVLLVVFPGDKPDELRLHARFAAHRVDGEWFRACPEIDAFLKALREVAA